MPSFMLHTISVITNTSNLHPDVLTVRLSIVFGVLSQLFRPTVFSYFTLKGVRSIVMNMHVCRVVSPLAYLRNHTTELTKFLVHVFVLGPHRTAL